MFVLLTGEEEQVSMNAVVALRVVCTLGGRKALKKEGSDYKSLN